MTLAWPRTTGTITRADLLRQSVRATGPDGRSRDESWNSFHVLYTYRVGDHEYVAGGVEPQDFGMQNSAGAARMRERHPVGSTAQVAYDPNDPALAYLEPGPSSFALVLSGVGSLMALVGFWVRRKASQGIGSMTSRARPIRFEMIGYSPFWPPFWPFPVDGGMPMA